MAAEFQLIGDCSRIQYPTGMSELRVTESDLKGLYEIDLVLNADSRGSFREAFQAAKLEALGLPHLGPVQWNISENARAGIIRGIHAEPWDKYIHIPSGSVFAAIVDLRPDSATFGQHRTFTLNHSNAIFISRGLGNAFQALEPAVYCYLVNAHWQAGLQYPSVVWNDLDLAITWPLQPGPDDLSEKDQQNPTLRQAFPEKFNT